MDQGNRELFGQVTDSNGWPVSGAMVMLTWASQYEGLRSRSLRRTVSDIDGRFRFSALGRANHLLTVEAPGFHHAEEIQLDRTEDAFYRVELGVAAR